MGFNDPKVKLVTEFGHQGALSLKGLTIDAQGNILSLTVGGTTYHNGGVSGPDISLGASAIGFFGTEATTQPVIAHTATAQSIADALVALGLCSQAAS